MKAVVFDVGETLVDETREYGTWADWLGVPRHAFSSVFGAVIASGRDYRDAFQYFRPGFDLAAERQVRAEAGQPETFSEGDLYADARPCLEALRGMGVWVGIAGNQGRGLDGSCGRWTAACPAARSPSVNANRPPGDCASPPTSAISPTANWSSKPCSRTKR